MVGDFNLSSDLRLAMVGNLIAYCFGDLSVGQSLDGTVRKLEA